LMPPSSTAIFTPWPVPARIVRADRARRDRAFERWYSVSSKFTRRGRTWRGAEQPWGWSRGRAGVGAGAGGGGTLDTGAGRADEPPPPPQPASVQSQDACREQKCLLRLPTFIRAPLSTGFIRDS
jgi:hypothetical protein